MLVDLTVGNSAVCAVTEWSGYTGTWTTLSTVCAKPAGVPAGAVLLGWATTVDFPVAIAQRQSDNKWGTYEIRDADGVLVAVFIPAGWETFISGENTLYPIWSKYRYRSRPRS